MLIAIEDRVPSVDESAFVAVTATLIGSVVLEEGASVWYGVVARGDMDTITIGAGSNIQDNTVLHTDPGLHLRVGRDGRLSAGRYVPFVLEAAAREPDGALVAMALENAVQAATEYTPAGGDRDAMLTLIVQTSWDLMTDPARGPDQQLVWARALGAAALSCPARSAEVSRLLAGATVPGLAMGAALRWLFLRGLAATGQIGPDELDAELARDQTSSAPVRHRAALASLPTAAAKRAAWDALLGDATLTNHELSASAEGFATPGQGALRVPYVEAYFTALPRVWASRSQELAQRVVTGAFPSGIPPESGLDVPTLATGWLAAHPDAPGALRRKIVELTDDAQRAARARAHRIHR